MPVLPPIEASTMASNVVGIWTTLIPRNHVAAAKPVMSPITPPPRAIINDPLSNLASYAALWIKSIED